MAVREAREEAERIISDAHAEAERIRADLERALREKAQEDARAELAAERVALERARRAMLDDAEATVRTLALAVARRLVAEELETHPERIRSIVREASERVRRASRVRVRVSPADCAALGPLDAEIVEDPSVERGGCVVESDLGDVDARLEVRLEALARALAGER